MGGHDMQSNKRHNRHYSNSAAHNHLDTIRKCNGRGIQILHEIIEKNRRKRSDGYGLNKYGSSSHSNSNVFSTSNHQNYNKRKSHKIPNMQQQNGDLNRSRNNVMINYDDHEDDYERYHSTKSTRFSDKKRREKHKEYNNPQNQTFDFDSAPVPFSGVNDPHSTRSRGYGHGQIR